MALQIVLTVLLFITSVALLYTVRKLKKQR